MKPKFWNPSSAAFALSLAISSMGQAAVYYWDADGNTTTGTGGAGDWKNNSNFWRSGSPTGALVDSNSWPNTTDNDVVFAGTAGTVTLNNPQSVNDITFDTAGYNIASGALTLVGATPTITANADATIGLGLAGSAGLIKAGAAKLLLSGPNTYSGITKVQLGVLELGNSNVLADASTIEVSGGTLSLLANSDTVAGVQLTAGSITGSTGILTSTTAFGLQSGSVSAKLGGTVGVTKTTGGTVILSGVNTYTGQTQVSGGKLTVDSTGQINSSSDVLISAGELNYNSSTALTKAVSFSGTGGTLSGSGAINTAVTVTSNNTYSAGAVGDPGTQILTGGITLNTGSIFSWDLDATNGADPGVLANQGTYDKVTGNGSGGGIFNVVLGTNLFSSAFWDSNKTWTDIFSGTDPSFSIFGGTDGVSSVAPSGLVTGQGQFSYSGGTLTWTAVPEPTSALAGLLLGAGLLRRRRI